MYVQSQDVTIRASETVFENRVQAVTMSATMPNAIDTVALLEIKIPPRGGANLRQPHYELGVLTTTLRRLNAEGCAQGVLFMLPTQ